jgi:hypothetical protein
MLLALRVGDNSDRDLRISKGMNMNNYERQERHNFLTWYYDANREEISKALRTDWEKFVELLIKYDIWILIINTQLKPK